jgi:hypothetical protein
VSSEGGVCMAVSCEGGVCRVVSTGCELAGTAALVVNLQCMELTGNK